MVIEVNQQCNIRCRACYKDKYGLTKPAADIMDEVDLALSQRNVSMVTLAGCEPSLHPRLDEVISYVAGRGVAVQILSNGYQLTEEKLARYKLAGLSTSTSARTVRTRRSATGSSCRCAWQTCSAR